MTTQEFTTYQEQTFDSYAKRLIHNEGADARKELARRAKREVQLSALSSVELSALARENGYSLEEVTLFVRGNEVNVFNAVLGQSCLNGSSEMVGQLAAAITTFLFNNTMMKLLGEDGVAAITIIIYSQFLLNALYIGYSMGTAPVIGFNYGNLGLQCKCNSEKRRCNNSEHPVKW